MKLNSIEIFLASEISAVLVVVLNILIALSSLRDINFFGIAIIIIGELIYGYNNFAMRGAWSIDVEPKQVLVKSGFFKYIRHPLYLGSAIASFGIAVCLMSLPGLIYSIFIVLPYVYFRAKLEEKVLTSTLKGYKEYMKETGMFFPKMR
ncbi:Phospholipid methyltransferase [Candidatus Tiddalikarchaeum anstoanum]|nr:Phospholipid methyltransferase [Candidatus Tiddalikarchaeum anstoanum]